jgi:hypothetical protein
MSDAPENMENNVVPIFRTFDDLKHKEQRIMGEFLSEWEGAYRKFDAVQAAISGDSTALEKFATDEVVVAKYAVDNSIRKYGDAAVANIQSTATLAKTLKAAVDRRNERLFGLGALAARSLRFVTALQRRHCGPPASVTSIGVAR